MTHEADMGPGDDAADAAAGGERGLAVHVVLLRALPGSSLTVPLAGQAAVDLHSEAGAADGEMVRSLLDSSLLVDACEDFPLVFVEELRRRPVPTLFRASPWLRRCRALVIEDEGTVLGAVRITYRTGRGLRVESADLTSE